MRGLVVAIIATLPLILPYVVPEILSKFIGTYVLFYVLLITLVSLLLSLFIFLGSRGERRYLMLSLAITLGAFAVGSLATYLQLQNIYLDFTEAYLQLMEKITTSVVILIFFVGLYFPLFAFGVWKISREIGFIKLRDLVVGLAISAFLLVLVLLTTKIPNYSLPIQDTYKDFYIVSIFFDIVLLFIYTVLVLIFRRTDAEIYFFIVAFFMIFWFIADTLSLAGIVYMGAPLVMYALGVISVFSGLIYVYDRDIAMFTYSGILEEKEKLAEQYKATKELQEVMGILNRMLRHDVKNKLQIILSYVEAYMVKRDDSYLQRVIEAANEINKYLDRIREIDAAISAENEPLKPVNVRKVVEEVLKTYDIPAKVQGSGIALADDTLYSVIDNVVNNAIKHGKTDKIDVYISRVEDEIEIRIVDYGVGIPSEAKKKIFEGYNITLKERTGLGLYIVKKAVERYGGRVWVEDTKPKGATFVIRLKTPPKNGEKVKYLFNL
ncbi:MAG: hypothetical protein HA489_01480 [Archaeoglobales archaeon]|nr:hypothetical protein [Archaeoglobales archaeon]